MQKKNADKTPAERLLLRLHVGAVALQHNPLYYVALLVYLVLVVLLGSPLHGAPPDDLFTSLATGLHRTLYPLYAIAGLLACIVLFGYPHGARKASRSLARAGIVNSVGEAPMLLIRRKDRYDPRLLCYEFDSADLPLSYWQDHQQEIEAALNICVIKMSCSRGKHRIRLSCVPAVEGIPDYVEYASAVLPTEEAQLALGVGLVGTVTVDLSKTAHLLIAGNSGSGKTVLLRCLLRQAVEKGYRVYIADYKGGIDFSPWWHEHCTVAYDENDVLSMLQTLVEELRHRMVLLKLHGVNDIVRCNTVTNQHLPRILIAFDEIAEALDKTGADKSRKEHIAQVEQCLATLSRLGRACSIHLIIGVQRPDVNAVPAQIKTNLSYRCCSRADNVLSMIALDNTSAADQIPKDSRGRFIDSEGQLFQAYYLKEESTYA